LFLAYLSPGAIKEKMKEDTNTKEIDHFFPAMGRCPLCGRFMVRGLLNWMAHTYDKCISPEAEEIRSMREVIMNSINYGRNC